MDLFLEESFIFTPEQGILRSVHLQSEKNKTNRVSWAIKELPSNEQKNIYVGKAILNLNHFTNQCPRHKPNS